MFFLSIQDIQKLRSVKGHALESFLSASCTLGHMSCDTCTPQMKRNVSLWNI